MRIYIPDYDLITTGIQFNTQNEENSTENTETHSEPTETESSQSETESTYSEKTAADLTILRPPDQSTSIDTDSLEETEEAENHHRIPENHEIQILRQTRKLTEFSDTSSEESLEVATILREHNEAKRHPRKLVSPLLYRISDLHDAGLTKFLKTHSIEIRMPVLNFSPGNNRKIKLEKISNGFLKITLIGKKTRMVNSLLNIHVLN
jgi:hypothetical protein